MEEKFDNVALLPVINEKCDIIIHLFIVTLRQPGFSYRLTQKVY